MESFDTFDELWMYAAQQIRDNGETTPSRDGGSREVLGFAARLNDPTANFCFNPVRKASPSYAAAELLWYLSGQTDITMIKAYAPQYQRFVSGSGDDGINAWGAYGGRMLSQYDSEFQDPITRLPIEIYKVFGVNIFPPYIGQLELLIWLLKHKQDTRQAIISFWKPIDLIHAILGDKNDLPCTIGLNFIVRNNKLHCSAYMRSNDIWLGLTYDIFCFTSIQRIIADILGLELGWYQHYAMSMHVYERNEEKMYEAASPPSFSTGPLKYSQATNPRLRAVITEAVKLEEWNRKIKGCTDHFGIVQEHSLLGQAITMAASKWDDNAIKRIDNKVMKNYLGKETVCL